MINLSLHLPGLKKHKSKDLMIEKFSLLKLMHWQIAFQDIGEWAYIE